MKNTYFRLILGPPKAPNRLPKWSQISPQGGSRGGSGGVFLFPPFFPPCWSVLGASWTRFGGVPGGSRDPFGALGGGWLGVLFSTIFPERFCERFWPQVGAPNGSKSGQEGSRNRRRSERAGKPIFCTPPTQNGDFRLPKASQDGLRTGRKLCWKGACTQDRGEEPKMAPKRSQRTP